jgi:predicted small metal-binding protein
MTFLTDLYLISEGKDMDSLPEDVMNEIQKNIRTGAKDLEQLWSNALELVHKAYEVSGVQRPTPDMKNAWKQYEQNLQYAVQQLSKYRGIKGDWRMSSSVFHEALQKMVKFGVRLSGPGHSEQFQTQARSMQEVIDELTQLERANPGMEIRVTPHRDGDGVFVLFFQYGVRIKYRVDITPMGVIGINA